MMNHNRIARTLTRVIRMSIAAGLLAGLFAVTQPARAEIYVVTNTLDSGSGSLRDAINQAYSNPGPDTIKFDSETDGTPIVLTGAAGENGNASGDLDILDGGDLTIQGNGTANTIIDGGGADRAFHICPGYGCTNIVTLSGMTIKNGNANGGGIFNEGGTLKVVGSTIRDNTGNYGGGIYNQLTGTVTVDASTIRDNTAVYGGGIFNKATLTVLNGSTIGGATTGNTATDGGGIYNQLNATTMINDSSISANIATAEGGGIYNNTGGYVTVNASVVSANTAPGGGGIYNKGTTLNILNGSTIGGAGTGNVATAFGGGIFNEIGTTTVNGSTVSANKSQYGAGIYNAATLIVQNGSLIGGVGSGNQGIDNLPLGGGIYNDTGASATIDNSIISANTAYIGGGIFNKAILKIQNGSLIGGSSAGNQASNYGGGISNETDGTTIVDGSTVSANKSWNGAFTNCGGGIYNDATLVIQNGSTIGGTGAGNHGVESGGGICNSANGTATVDSSTVSANTAKNGGGIYNFGTLIVTNSSKISANQATIWGGGIYNYAGNTTVTGSCILNNWATINGGGLFNDENSFGATIVTGSSIVGNSATSFFNNQAAEQIATGNWWGVATGPNKPGADMVGGNVDTGGYLTEPISDCFTNIYLPLVRK